MSIPSTTRKWLRACFGIALFILIVIVLSAVLKNPFQEGSNLWVIYESKRIGYRPITVSIPSRSMPNPNAYDTFLESGALLQHEKDINAAYKNVKIVDGELKNKLKDNTAALQLLRRGLRQHYLHPAGHAANEPFHYLKKWYTLGKANILLSRLQQSQGEYSIAAQNALDTIQFGVTIPRGANMIFVLCGHRIQAAGRRELERCLPHMTAQQAQEASRRMENISKMQQSCAEVLEDEYYANYIGICQPFINDISSATQIIKTNKELQARRMREIFVDLYVKHMQQSITNARLRFPEQKILPQPKGMLAAVLAVDGNKVAVRVINNQVKHELLVISIGLRAYYLTHHKYPDNLAQLVPHYLLTNPDDPYAKINDSYRYKKSENGYILYSIGPDGHDDGGKPSVSQSNISQTDKSSGDITPGETDIER